MLAQPFHCTDEKTEALGQEVTSFLSSKEDNPYELHGLQKSSQDHREKSVVHMKELGVPFKLNHSKWTYILDSETAISYGSTCYLWGGAKHIGTDLPEDKKQKHWKKQFKRIMDKLP